MRTLADLPLSDDPMAVLAHCPGSVSCLPVTVFPIPGMAELSNDLHPHARIFVAQQGTGNRWYQIGGRTRAMRTEPRMIEMYEKGLAFDHCRWEGEAGRSVLIELLDEEVQAITHGELQRLELPTQHELFDDRVSHLTLELAHEALNGLPNGRLYAQGLSMALLGVLAGAYATSRARVAAGGRLGSAQVQRLKAFIDEQLGSDLSLVRLAGEAGLSAFHFARMFKATFGMTPHRYIQERRLHAAARALRREPRRAIADIALACGFANQSHMTSLMRERLGVTPRALRDERE